MQVNQLISQELPFVQPDDSPDKVIGWMEEFRVGALPFVVDEIYHGMVREDELLSLTAGSVGEMYANMPFFLNDKFLQPFQHFFDVFLFADEHKVDVIPVIGEKHHFEGAVLLSDTTIAFSRKLNAFPQGGTITLEVDAVHYSLAEISRLAESNHTKITHLLVEPVPENPAKLLVTTGFNTKELKHTIATFQRFNYKVVGQYQLSDPQSPNLERLNLLLKYLEI